MRFVVPMIRATPAVDPYAMKKSVSGSSAISLGDAVPFAAFLAQMTIKKMPVNPKTASDVTSRSERQNSARYVVSK